MQVNRGLFKLDLVDHHAILGIPLDADAKQVRKRYLKIARKLHPDSLRTASDEQKQQASELLSKLVNPAYEVLSQERSSVEHKVSLRLKGEQLQKQPALLSLSSEQSKKVANSNNIDYEYANALKALVLEQYESLDTAINAIGEISELNAVYVMRQGSSVSPAAKASAAQGAPANGGAVQADDPTKTRVKSSSERRAELIKSFINRAKEFEYKGNFSRAIVELREAVKAHPQTPLCHAELGRMYMRSKQLKMAGIHTKRALELDPNNQIATDVKKKLDAYAKRRGKNPPDDDTSSSGRVSSKTPKKPKGGGGSLFGGLFGGKKRK